MPRCPSVRSLCLMTVLLSGCGRAAMPAVAWRSTTLHIGVPKTLLDFTPSRVLAQQAASFDALVFDGLTSVDDSGRVGPGLAERWELSPDGRTYRFALRANVRFHDGQPFGADDVVQAWKRALRDNPAGEPPWMLMTIAGARAYASGATDTIDGLQAVDPQTLVVRLESPLAPFLSMLSMAQVAIPAARSLPTRPIGTGPWRWVSGLPGDSTIRLVRNPAHWHAPVLDSIAWLVLPPSQIGTALRSGRIDYAFGVLPQDAAEVAARPDIGFGEAAPMTLVYLLINHRVASLHDLRVRTAICQAIDAEGLRRALDVTTGMVAAGPVPPGVVGHDPALRRCVFDPRGARMLLEQSGYPHERPVTIGVTRLGTTVGTSSIGYQLAHYLEAAGLRTRVRERTNPLRRSADSLDDLTVAAWMPDYPDGDTYLYPIFHSDVAGLPTNRGGWADPETDRLLEASRTALDPAEHERWLRATAARVTAQRANIMLWFERPAVGYSLRLTGWSIGWYPSTFSDVRLVDARR